jgi:hypothetical protein
MRQTAPAATSACTTAPCGTRIALSSTLGLLVTGLWCSPPPPDVVYQLHVHALYKSLFAGTHLQSAITANPLAMEG